MTAVVAPAVVLPILRDRANAHSLVFRHTKALSRGIRPARSSAGCGPRWPRAPITSHKRVGNVRRDQSVPAGGGLRLAQVRRRHAPQAPRYRDYRLPPDRLRGGQNTHPRPGRKQGRGSAHRVI